ncbi:MAG: VWA domain-containing protein [Ruminococcus sp.]|uniref:vWA domain-containing protein n=1 Tax=Ruminococcus sp. TaxID=41978 RepID=UPI0025E354FA|nr:vWA domain-containing protein [Ruminococcus sp.]MBO4867851.1 VWA domain-containing protein [Ruminococcus sp.]
MKKNNNNITELVFVLDRSGSMAGLESDTVGGFNSLIKDQKNSEGKAFVTTVLFDTEFIYVHDRADISKVKPLTEKDYVPRGCTALLDAVGMTIQHIAGIHKYARPEDVPSKTIFVITTDGMENASREFRYDTVKKLIEKEQKKYGWEFIFLGANIDAAETAGSMGIAHASNYKADGKGTKLMYGAVGRAVTCMRESAPLAADWNAEMEEDAAR